MGCTLQRTGVHGENEADASGGEIHLAKACKRAGDVAPEDVDRHRVADLQAHLLGLFGGETDKGWAFVVFGPPFSRRDTRVLGHVACVGHPAVSFEHPMATRDLACRAVVDLCDDAAQHGGRLDTPDGWIIFQPLNVPVDLVLLDVHEKVTRGHLRQVAGDGIAQVAVDLANGGEDRKAETQRQNDRGCPLSCA